jgi:hypothetical protein
MILVIRAELAPIPGERLHVRFQPGQRERVEARTC